MAFFWFVQLLQAEFKGGYISSNRIQGWVPALPFFCLVWFFALHFHYDPNLSFQDWIIEWLFKFKSDSSFFQLSHSSPMELLLLQKRMPVGFIVPRLAQPTSLDNSTSTQLCALLLVWWQFNQKLFSFFHSQVLPCLVISSAYFC